MIYVIYWWLQGWRTGLPDHNDDYLVQNRDGSYSIEEYIGGCRHWEDRIAFWKRLRGPIAQPPISLTYSPNAPRPHATIKRPGYFMQRPKVKP